MKWLLWTVLILVPQVFQNPFTFIGTAHDLKTDRLLYREETKEFSEDGNIRHASVAYFTQGNVKIAEKTIQYKDPVKPDFRLNDLRDGYIEGTESAGPSLKVFCRMSEKEYYREKIIDVPEPAVTDAGIYNFIRINWNDLTNGKMITCNVVVPAELDYYQFRIEKISNTSLRGRKAVVFKMQANSFILKMVLEPILMTFDSESRRMMQYEGISNINDEQGNNYKVSLTFDPSGP